MITHFAVITLVLFIMLRVSAAMRSYREKSTGVRIRVE